MNKFFVSQSAIKDSNIEIRSKEDINHIVNVLRMGKGDKVQVSDSCRFEYLCSIEAVDKSCVALSILDKQAFSKEPDIDITLFQGIPKSSKMDLIVQKNVELGVTSFVPVFMDRTVVEKKSNIDKKIQRWQRISEEAVKQCKRGIIPQVLTAVDSDGMKEELGNFDLVVFPYENEEKRTLKNLLTSLTDKPKRIALVIGPEGGFSQREALFLNEISGGGVSLGKTVLRTETAGIVAVSMIMYELSL